MERVFSRKLLRPRDCRKYFFQMLLSVSRLYLDYLVMRNEFPRLEKASSVAKAIANRASPLREAALRKRFRRRLESLPCWSFFEPSNAFSESTGLKTRQHYLDSFASHLPEIYEETLHVESCARAFLRTSSGAELAALMVGLEHLGRNHISFVHFALEWAADEGSWVG